MKKDMSKTAENFLHHQEEENAKFLLENQSKIKGIHKKYLVENQNYQVPGLNKRASLDRSQGSNKSPRSMDLNDWAEFNTKLDGVKMSPFKAKDSSIKEREG